MRVLGIDIETYCSVDLAGAGVYAYTSAPDFEIILFAYAFDGEEVRIVDLAGGEKLPEEVLAALSDDTIIKAAFNAQFERVALSRYLGRMLSPVSWRCTAVQALMLGLPSSLEGVAQALSLAEHKLKEGSGLIRYFCYPHGTDKTSGKPLRHMSKDSPEKWKLFKEYCIRDVEVEMAIRRKIERYPISQREQEVYILDQELNDRGILVDMELVLNAIELHDLKMEEGLNTAREITGLNNPNSTVQLKKWLKDKGVSVDSLSKKAVSTLAEQSEGEVEQLLNLRLQLSKTSIKKYEAVKRAVCPDGRVRGLLKFYGASRTGRWAGQLVQVQNLPQNHLDDLDLARSLLREGRFDDIELLYESVLGVLSELIRTAFIPCEGHRFIAADFSAIEARIIAWAAGEKWRLDVFSSHGKIYEASAAMMFKVPIESITKGSPLRQKRKIAELALGYGGSVGALTSMGALQMGVPEDELPQLVSAWRAANPNITRLWWEVDSAALKAVKLGIPQTVGKIRFDSIRDMLFITLPSGRRLSYFKPKLLLNKFGREGLTYEGIGEGKHWCRIDTYGPKLVENIVQAISRDILAEAMVRLKHAGYNIVIHVHDEVVIEALKGQGSLEEVCGIMSIAPLWAQGLPLKADGFECQYYKKE